MGGTNVSGGFVHVGLRPHPQVFKKEFGNINWSVANHTVSNALPKGLHYAAISTETVKNDAYDVAGGTKVELLVFMINSPLCVFFSRIDNPLTQNRSRRAGSIIPGQNCV